MDYKKAAADLFETVSAHVQTEHARKFDKYAKGESMTLKFLAANGGKTTPFELCEQSYNSSARITNILNRLEEKGEIIRIAHPDDRRKITVMITPLGLERTRREKREMQKRLELTLRKMKEADATDFIRTAKIFLDTAETISKERPACDFAKKHKHI